MISIQGNLHSFIHFWIDDCVKMINEDEDNDDYD